MPVFLHKMSIRRPSYEPLQHPPPAMDGNFTIDDDDDDFGDDQDAHVVASIESGPQQQEMEPLELETDEIVDKHDAPQHYYLFTWSHPWLLSTCLSLFMVIPVLIRNMVIFYELFGRIWTVTPFAVHLLLSLTVTRLFFVQTENNNLVVLVASSLVAVVDIVVFGVAYPLIWSLLMDGFFTDFDGTDIIDYAHYKRDFRLFQRIGVAIALARGILGAVSILARLLHNSKATASCLGDNNPLARPCIYVLLRRPPELPTRLLRRILSGILTLAVLASLVLVVWCFYSLAAHWLPWKAPLHAQPDLCDSLDETECIFPFPSFHHMRPDSTTDTGWRVHLPAAVLPPLKGGIDMQLDFCNRLDGFSTMGALLFYLDGLKEGHEAGANQLQGPSHVAQSVTPQSVTLLVDVTAQTLVAHSAEVDYLDADHPCIMVFPAAPLQHDTHYALAVVNATDARGHRLPPTRGMKRLLRGTSDRRTRYVDTLIPALEAAADWVAFAADPESLQLLFDFQTISEASQLGTVRAVRDATLTQVSDWSWDQHVQTIRIQDEACRSSDILTARTVHAQLEVPWFLNGFGAGHRAAVMDTAHVTGRQRLGLAKFVVQIPCSVRAAALEESGGKPLRVLMEFGHSLFYTREEVREHFLQKMAHDEGYVIIAMDWRGMSNYDMLVIAKVLMSRPGLFEAVRDNLIQGYANKYALQHFAKNGMLSMPWFDFAEEGTERSAAPTYDGKAPTRVFYGISQGGILGAGYSALSGATGLIERAALGVPGTPFALVLSRSLKFAGYDSVMLLNFYRNRHIRILLSLVQMGWDSVEASGALARPVREPYPRMLLQAGLGDPIVPTIAAEALARGLNATILPHSPRSEIYGIPRQSAKRTNKDPYVTLTELMYDEEYVGLPVDDTPAKDNSIHICVRLDPALIEQLQEFFNSGHVLDPCTGADGCHRTDGC